jgi:predicted dehydrogenase
LLATGEAEIVALNDLSEDNLHRLKQQVPETANCRVYANHGEMLEAEQLDAVTIMSPHTLHFEQAMDAFDHGLHVLLEKPMVCGVDNAKKLIARRDEVGKVLLISYQRHYLPEFRFMKRTIESGEFGQVQFVSAMQCQDWKRATAGTWRQDPALSGGGQLNDSGSHLLDVILWLTGLRAESVFALVANLGTPVDINSAISVRFEGGAEGSISVVGEAPVWWEDITLWGSEAALFLRNGELTVKPYGAVAFTPTALPEGSNPDANFVEAVLRGAAVESTAEGALRVMELTEAAWLSGKTGHAVRVGETHPPGERSSNAASPTTID